MERVLVVDDEETQRRTVALGLKIEGFSVATAAGADEAIERLRAEPYDLVLLDLMMPGTNGLGLARRIREEFPAVKVVLTSAYPLSPQQLARLDLDIAGFVRKGSGMAEMAAELRRCASRSAPPLGRDSHPAMH